MKKNILITGAAKRIGENCARLLHSQGHNVVIHYRHSQQQAENICQQLNQQRSNSAHILHANLLDHEALRTLSQQAIERWGNIDVLINNASTFYPQAVEEVGERNWDELMNCHVKAPFFLSQALMPTLKESHGCIVNIIDIHAERGLRNYPVYSLSKAGLAAMTRILAKEFAPYIRVNGVSPGAILWPKDNLSPSSKADIIDRIALKRAGKPEDIARIVAFLINEADYITGEIIKVDGGRNLFC